MKGFLAWLRGDKDKADIRQREDTQRCVNDHSRDLCVTDSTNTEAVDEREAEATRRVNRLEAFAEQVKRSTTKHVHDISRKRL